MLFVAGVVIVFGSVLYGYVMSHGQLLALWQPFEILIIVGAAFGAGTAVGTTGAVVAVGVAVGGTGVGVAVAVCVGIAVGVAVRVGVDGTGVGVGVTAALVVMLALLSGSTGS